MESKRIFWRWFAALAVGLVLLLTLQFALTWFVLGEELARVDGGLRTKLGWALALSALSFFPFLGWGLFRLFTRYVHPFHIFREDVEAAIHGERAAPIFSEPEQWWGGAVTRKNREEAGAPGGGWISKSPSPGSAGHPEPGGRAIPGESALADLRYVVFDTETTGLEPSHGDEIVSLAAVEVVLEQGEGRIVSDGARDWLVDPGRPISPASRRVHGIADEMVAGQPSLAKVLLEFHRFAEGAVLVAHNAAFDMKFLNLKEETTGIRFGQPLLDTMLLSAAIHPHQPSHALDSLIRRYGLAGEGRHSALGDASITAELLLRLLPQLIRRGITTLDAAQSASRKTPLARMEF